MGSVFVLSDVLSLGGRVVLSTQLVFNMHMLCMNDFSMKFYFSPYLAKKKNWNPTGNRSHSDEMKCGRETVHSKRLKKL
jgi:hypothetical protein